jgi:hypothetical protein
MKYIIPLAGLILILALGPLAYAEGYSAGAACSTNGAYHVKNETDGVYHMVCNGSSWVLAAYMEKTGKIGIGTSSPVSKLHIEAASPTTLYGHVGYNGNLLEIRTNTTSNSLLVQAGSSGLQVNGGAGAPSSVLGVSSNGSVPTFSVVHGSSQTADLVQVKKNDNTPYFYIKSSGAVGIGTTAPDTILDVNGAITQRPLSSDPANPDAGGSVMWVSDGTGAGDAGDVMIKINVGGSVKTATLVDYSSL